MNFNTIFLKSFRILLFPVSLVYGLIIIIRNFLYTKNIIRSASFNFPLIVIGNLSTGGTGKSPMTEYLVRLLMPHYKIATISRGYKRKTKGYALANENSTALEIGDEPMQFHIKFPELAVAVGEERIVAIPQLLHDRPNTQAIILDDAFQHREIRATMNILLTQHGDLYSNDFFLPTGDLRDEWSSAKRAQIIIVTKCPAILTDTEKNQIIKLLKPQPEQEVFFTSIKYGTPYHIIHHTEKAIRPHDEILLVCGIANPKPLKQYLSEHAAAYYQQEYGDHHIFRIDDLKDIEKKFNAIQSENKVILTTEKDAVRLMKFKDELQNLPVYVLPVVHHFLFDEGQLFDKAMLNYVQHFKLIE